MAKGIKRILETALGLLLFAQGVVFLFYLRDQLYLQRLIDHIASATAPPSVQVQSVLNHLRNVPVITNKSYILAPVFHFLRATPRQVAEQGGDCADRSRLMIVLLRLHGISASKWALYSPALRPVHAVVGVQTEQGLMVADTLFGITYPRPDGGYYSVVELRNNPILYRQRIQYLQSTHQHLGGENLEDYPLDRYIFENARTINWEKSSVMHISYTVLRAVFGKKVDQIARPFFVEQPALMVIIVLGAVEACILLLLFILSRMPHWGISTRSIQSGSPDVLAPVR